MAQASTTQQRILDVLSDGEQHTREELMGCLYDELGTLRNLSTHISILRAYLLPQRKVIDGYVEYHGEGKTYSYKLKSLDQ